jgi:hypothetical protein
MRQLRWEAVICCEPRSGRGRFSVDTERGRWPFYRGGWGEFGRVIMAAPAGAPALSRGTGERRGFDSKWGYAVEVSSGRAMSGQWRKALRFSAQRWTRWTLRCCHTKRPNDRLFGAPPVVPAPGSGARGSAPAGIHDLPSLQQKKSWIPALAGMTRGAARASMFGAVGINRGPLPGFRRALPRSGLPTGKAGRVCAPADTVAARR